MQEHVLVQPHSYDVQHNHSTSVLIVSTREGDRVGTRTCTAPLVQRTAQLQHVSQRREGGGAETHTCTAPLGCLSLATYSKFTARQSVT